ncbi:hypothetical protein [Sulfitobacter pontiacus]|uniref:hypothetical protein n=1 Tax=Sulfitobacter pontiacus TaxID=60137 RepID=UPI0004453D3F|nr:hypothetical protein [Sulfitobacter pontiacus]KAJ29156.1 hypothetical protein PM01_15940 [Sulfitobacter pontiacus 3SOLIMAR09]
MLNDYFNDPIDQATGQNSGASPQSLMFERLVSNMQSTLDEEVFFDDSDWPEGFDWCNDRDAVWEGLAEDAFMLARFRTRKPADKLLCRAAGLIHRAIRSRSPLELEAAQVKFAQIMQSAAPARVYFMLEEAELCLEQMAERAEADEPGNDLGFTPDA